MDLDAVSDSRRRVSPAILVSVRSPEEALVALEGGAEVIDVKEPERGSLGRADLEKIVAIADAVEGRRRVTAAAGELVDAEAASLRPWLQDNPAELVKFGLAGAAATDWRKRLSELASTLIEPSKLVPVAYADRQAAKAPPPREIACLGAELGCRWLLVDTYDKSAGRLLSYFSLADLSELRAVTHRLGLCLGLAGSLCESDLAEACSVEPDLLGFRGAACEGGRQGVLSPRRVRQLHAQRNSAVESLLDAKKI